MIASAVASELLLCARDDRRQNHVECGEDVAARFCRLGPGLERVWRSSAARSGQVRSKESDSWQRSLVYPRNPWRAVDARNGATRGKTYTRRDSRRSESGRGEGAAEVGSDSWGSRGSVSG